MRRSQVLGLVCLTACLMLASTAMAQGQGRGRGRGGFGGGGFNAGSSQLLRNEKVQEELKLTSEQKEKLAALREEGGGRGRGGFGGFDPNQSEEEREKAMAEFRKRMEESNKKAEAVLEPAQLKRLKELSLQARGNGALNDEEVAKALKLSEDQVASVKTISEAMGTKMREMFQSGGAGGNREEMQKQMAELRKDADAEYLAVLTDEQKAKFAEMKGADAKIDFNAGGFGGRGGRRRGGNNN